MNHAIKTCTMLTMPVKNYTYSFSFSHIPPVMRRGKHSLAILQDKKGNYILGGKDIYPKGIYRLIGGGVNSTEKPVQGLMREMHEETGLQVVQKNIKHLAHIESDFTNSKKQRFIFHIHLFHLVVDLNKLTPLTDLDEIRSFTPNEFKKLISNYSKLPSKLVHLSKIP